MDINLHGVNRKLFIVLIVVLFFSLFYTSGTFNWVVTTGKSSGFCSGTCYDTDMGNIYVKGIVSTTNDNCAKQKDRMDICSETNYHYLIEYNCDLTKPANWNSESVYCENGCYDGACI